MLLPLPHVGGAVQIGDGAGLTVLINRKPAIAIDAPTMCAVRLAGTIATASGDVFYQITNTIAGLAVTQDADGTIHVGDHIHIPPADERDIHAWGETTRIDDGDYGAHVLADIAIIGSTNIGKQRLQNLDASGKELTIVPNGGEKKNAFSAAKRYEDGNDPAVGGTGKGTDVEIQYTPEEWRPDPRAETTTSGADGDVVLFHEMTHAEHQQNGKADMSEREDNYHTNEEYNTIEPDENIYRNERGFNERHTHTHN